MATTTNYGWTTPNDTDLVKDGAAAIRTLGSSADTTVKNLSPGTTAGDLDYYTSGTAKARLGIGTAGQSLLVNAGATAPEWGTPAAGGMTLISTTTANNTVTNYTISSIPTTFKSLMLVGIDCQAGGGASLEIRVQLNGDTGAKYVKNAFGFVVNVQTNEMQANDNELRINGAMSLDADADNMRGQFVLWINNANSSSEKKGFALQSGTRSGGGLTGFSGTGRFNDSGAAITSVKFFTSGANIKNGTFLLYGMS